MHTFYGAVEFSRLE